MANFEANLATCRRCPFRQNGCEGENCTCTADGLPLTEHASSGQCPQNLFPPPADAKLVRGAVGIAKAISGTGGADPKLVEDRQRICSRCLHHRLTLGLLYQCDLCGCFTWAKVRNQTEKCPAGKW